MALQATHAGCVAPSLPPPDIDKVGLALLRPTKVAGSGAVSYDTVWECERAGAGAPGSARLPCSY